MKNASVQNSTNFHDDIMELRKLINTNWWKNSEPYFTFAKKGTTPIHSFANELAKATCQYLSKKISEQEIANEFRLILDLLDDFSVQKK